MRLFVVLSLVVTTVIACGQNATEPEIGAPANVVALSADGQEQVVGQRLNDPLAVLVTDANDNPVPGAEVSWIVTVGDGALSRHTSTTNASGETSAEWTLGTIPGENQAQAAVGNLQAVTFTAIARVGPPALVVAASGDGQEALVGATLPDSLVVRVEDVFSNPVPEVEVSWEVVAGDGSVSPATSTTDENGEARTEWTTGEPASNVVVARVGGLQATFTATVEAEEEEPEPEPEPEVLEHVSGNNQAGRAGSTLPEPIVVRVLGADGLAMAGVEVAWSVASDNGSVTPTATTTNSSGEASTVWTLGADPGDMQATAAVDGLDPLTFAATATPEPQPANIERVSGDGQAALVDNALADSLVVRVTDTDGSPAAGVEIVWATNSGSLNPSTSNTNNAGIARSRWTLGTQAGGVQATATAEGLEHVTFTATAEPLPESKPTTLVRVSGDDQTGLVGSTLPDPLVVEVRDQDGTPMAGVDVVWSVETGNGSVSPTGSPTNTSGHASTTWTLGSEPGEMHAIATVVGLDSVVFTATAEREEEERIPTTIERRTGSGWGDVLDGDTVGPMRVRVLDQHGDPLPATPVVWQNHALPEEMHTLLTVDHLQEDRTLVVKTDSRGESEMLWVTKRYRHGEHVGSNPDGRITTAKPLDTDIEPVVYEMDDFYRREMHVFEPVGPTSFEGDEGDSFTLKVFAADQFGQKMPDSRVRWRTDGPEYGQLSGAQQGVDILELTDGHGESTVTLTLGSFVGKHVVIAEPTDVYVEEGIGPVLFEIQSGTEPGPAVAVQIVSGNNQKAYRGQSLPEPLVARVVDEHGVPVPGERVIWSEPEGDDRETFGSVERVTDANGETRMEWRMPYVYGLRVAYVLLYDSLDDCCVGAEFWATSLPHPNDTDGYPLPTTAEIVSGDGQVGVVGRELPEPLVIRVYDQYGNVMPYADIWWSTTNDFYNFDPVGRLTGYGRDDNGLAYVRWELPHEPGTHHVRTWLGHEQDDPVSGGPRAIVPGPTFTATAIEPN